MVPARLPGAGVMVVAMTAPSPAPIFSPDDGIEKLLVQAYQGEVLGEAFFVGVADHLDDAELARKMRVLATLEQRTKDAVVPALERAGLPTEPDPEMLTLAEALVPDAAKSTWEDLLRSVNMSVTEQFIPLYRRIGELHPAERETADLLVAHELALRDFARAEIAGKTTTSLDPVHALAHMR
jgi:hypothetical protein